jgi:hypothetical protein
MNAPFATPTIDEHVAAYCEWWAVESRRAGTDWESLMEAHLAALEMLGFLDREPSSFERACERADACAPRPQKSRPRPTPSATIEAIKQSVRDGGIAALKQPANRERLSRCDKAAKAELRRWLNARKAAA